MFLRPLDKRNKKCKVFIIYKSKEINQDAWEKFFDFSLTCERRPTIFSASKYLIIKEDY